MIIEGGLPQLENLLNQQLRFFLLSEREFSKIKNLLPEVLEELEHCFSFSSNKYYRRHQDVFFSPFHSSQYCIFLYKLARKIFEEDGETILADKIYFLNKMMNNLDIFYGTELPKVFFTDHPLGAVLGKAQYGDYFSFRQGCTIGNNKGKYPRIGKHVKMWSNSKILGDCKIGDNVIISSGTYIKDQNIPANKLVFGISPNLILKDNNFGNITS